MTTPAHHDPDRLAATALIAANLAGCNCTPDVDLEELYPGMHRATVAHDHTCPILVRFVSSSTGGMS